MPSIIQPSRGELHVRKDKLANGELFWQGRNISNNIDTDFKEFPALAWDEGTLYIAKPSVFRNPDIEEPIPIAGARTYKSLVHRGLLTTQKEISEATFKYVREGDFYVFKNDATGGQFKNTDDFRKNDLLLITHADFDLKTGVASNVTYVKIDCSGGDAYQTRFNNENSNFKATDVESALKELEYEKLSYRGTLENQAQVNALVPEIGTLYLLLSDNLVFNHHPKYNFERDTKKGDFVYYLNDTDGWWHIPSGYTDSQDIDYDPTRAVELQRAVNNNDTTFQEYHINQTGSLKTVKDALDMLFSKKAQLDASGKVPLSQLHDTVLGAMQYCGLWDPLVDGDLAGINNPLRQAAWPKGKDTDNSQEDGSATANHNGDYYIVQTSGTNIQYADKTSLQANSTYSRYLELNSGDWIVYSKSPIADASVTDGGTYHWSKIDNSDRITALNFKINGRHDTGEALPATENTVVRIGTPTFAASDKLVLWDNAGVITVAGVRLVSQKLDENGRALALPRYTSNTNELENSTILNYTDQEKGELTLFRSNVSVGDTAHTFETETHGDIHIFPCLRSNTKGLSDSKISFYSADDDTLSSTLRRLDLLIDHNQKHESKVYLPDQSSKIIGKLAGVSLISGRIVKSIKDGYIESSSIEEHMRVSTDHLAENGEQTYHDGDVDSVEIHAPHFIVNNAEVRHITFGVKAKLDDKLSNGGKIENGHLPVDEYRANLYANEHQIGNIVVYLPSKSGTLITAEEIRDSMKGDTKVLPVFGPKETIAGVERLTLINSNIRQTANALFNTIKKSKSVRVPSDVEALDRFKATDDKEETVVQSNLVVGELSTDDEGNKYIKNNKNLLVTGETIFGGLDSGTTFLHPNRTFLNDTQYKDPLTEEQVAITDVHIDLPPVSGVLLTSNSRIDGGIWK